MPDPQDTENTLPPAGQEEPLPPDADTLADRHKARRQAYERLALLTAAGDTPTAGLGASSSQAASEAPPFVLQPASEQVPEPVPGEAPPAGTPLFTSPPLFEALPLDAPPPLDAAPPLHSSWPPDDAPPAVEPSPEAPPQPTQAGAAQESLLAFVVALPRRAAQGIGSLWQRLTRAKQAFPMPAAEPAVLESEAGLQNTGGMESTTEPKGAVVLASQLAEEPPTSQPDLTEEQPVRVRDRVLSGGTPVRSGGSRAWGFLRSILWRGRLGPAFWTVASLLSLTVNILLIVLLILVGRELFFVKNSIVSGKVNGLYDNFVLMDQARIRTTIQVSDTIQVNDTIPVVFDLPLNQKTTVVLTKDTPVNTTIYLNNTAVPLDLILRSGTELNIKLNMTVPVKQTIPIALTVPVSLTVPVDIPLEQTQLHRPFVGLQHVVWPFRQVLGEVPDSWAGVCSGALKPICAILRFK